MSLLISCSPFPFPNSRELGLDLEGFWGEFFAPVQGVPYPTSEAVPAVVLAAPLPEGKDKGKGGGASPEKGSSGAPSGEDASRIRCKRVKTKFVLTVARLT